MQYESMEQALDQIGFELGVSPDQIIFTIRTLPKAQEVDGLRVWIARLINENNQLQTQMADRNRRAEAAEAQTLAAAAQTSAAEARAVATEEARIRAKAESTKWHGVSRKFFDSFEFLGDVVTKARIFDECMKKPEAVSAAKILRMLVDFSRRVENLLKEIWSTFQLGDRGHEAGPSEQRPESVPEPSRPDPPSPPTGHYNLRGTTDRSTICLNSSTGGDTFSTGGSINAHHPRLHLTGVHSGLPEYR